MGAIIPRETRGFLNNNPGNIDRQIPQSQWWQGEIRDTNDPRLSGFQLHELLAGRFCVFSQAEWGIRALVKNLQAYHRGGWNTINKAINRWAPPTENDTEAYKARVEKQTGKDRYERFDPNSYVEMRALAEAIICVECGGMPYQGAEVENGLRLAGLVKPVSSSSTAKGAAVATAATAAQPMLGALQQPLQDTMDALSPLADTAPWVQKAIAYGHIALTVIAVAGVAWMLWERIKRAKSDAAIDHNPTVSGI
jgi:hypothetical protein